MELPGTIELRRKPLFLRVLLGRAHEPVPEWHAQSGNLAEMALAQFCVEKRRTCTTIRSVWTIRFSPFGAMSTMRPNQTRSAMTLDEQSFEGLLSAAYTIQEHNERRRRAQQTAESVESNILPESESLVDPSQSLPDPPQSLSEPPRSCPHCGAPKVDEAARCGSCGLDEFRPGERMQRNWASMWLKSQEHGLWPERSPEPGETIRKIGEVAHQDLPSTAPQSTPSIPTESSTGSMFWHGADEESVLGPALPEKSAPGKSPLGKSVDEQPIEQPIGDQHIDVQSLFGAALQKTHWNSEVNEVDAGALETIEHEGTELPVQPHELSAEENVDYLEAADAQDEAETLPARGSITQRLADIQVTLRFHRADLYLGLAVFVALAALLWPAASTQKRASLSPWERALITMGIAEAPAPAIHLQGDPSIEVWVDPHTALYYCPGAEPFGKTKDGRLSSQRDAQLDRFEPAGRSVCE